jgi:hypothetical protein
VCNRSGNQRRCDKAVGGLPADCATYVAVDREGPGIGPICRMAIDVDRSGGISGEVRRSCALSVASASCPLLCPDHVAPCQAPSSSPDSVARREIGETSEEQVKHSLLMHGQATGTHRGRQLGIPDCLDLGAQ